MAKLPIGFTPDVGDGTVAPDAPETQEMEIWWEDNFERNDGGLVQSLSSRFGDDPVARYENPDWARSFNGSADRPGLFWFQTEVEVFPSDVSHPVVLSDGDMVQEYVDRSHRITSDLQIPGEFQILATFSWTNISANDEVTARYSQFNLGVRFADIPIDDSGLDMGDPEFYFNALLQLESYYIVPSPGVNDSTFGAFETVATLPGPFDYAQLTAMDIPMTTGIDGPNQVMLGYKDGNWILAVEYPAGGTPYTRSFPGVAPIGQDGGPIATFGLALSGGSQYDIQPVSVHQIRVIKPLQGPYKGASLGARKRPGSPVLDILSDPWRGIDMLPDDSDLNYYGDNGIPDYAAFTDPLDPDSPVRG